MSGQKRLLFEHLRPLNDSFPVVSLYIFEETLELPFHAELNGLHIPTSYIKVSISYDRIIKYV